MFEYDQIKSKSNKEKHGIDFHNARRMWNDSNRVEIPAKLVNEPRFLLIAKIGNTLWYAVFTYRNDLIRIISVRRSRDYEKKIYNSSRIR